MKIYTKTGDNGTTRLVDGSCVEKFNPRVEAYGTIDELNSVLGVVQSLLTETYAEKLGSLTPRLEKIQNHPTLFDREKSVFTPSAQRMLFETWRSSNKHLNLAVSGVDSGLFSEPDLPDDKIWAQEVGDPVEAPRHALQQLISQVRDDSAQTYSRTISRK